MKKNSLLVIGAIVSISLLVSIDYHKNAFAISISVHTTGSTIQWVYGYTVGLQERVAVLRDAGATVILQIYNVNQIDENTVGYSSISNTTLTNISNVPNSTPPARIGNQIYFGGLDGTTGYIVNFNIATNTKDQEQSIGSNLYTYNLIAHGSALYGATEDLSGSAERVSLYDPSLNLLTATNTPTAGVTVFLCTGDSNSIYTVDRTVTNSRIREFSTISNTFVATLGSGNGVYTGCIGDGTYVYALRDTSEAIDRVTVATNTYSGSWSTGYAFTTSEGNWIAQNTNKLYVTDDNGMKIVQKSDGVLISNTNTYEQQVTTQNGIVYTGEGAVLARIVDEEEDSGESGNQTDGVCGNGTALDCVGDRSTINQITGAQNFTTVIGNLGTQLGILNTTANTDPETNGSGLILMLATGTFFASAVITSIAVANNKFGANIQYTEIPKEFWLFLVVGVVALAWYLNWIPDIVFYGMVVGLAGLFSFGLYTKYKGNG